MSVESATEIGRIAAESLEMLDDTSGLAEGETASVGMVATVAEIHIAEPDGPGRTKVFCHCSDLRPWVRKALLEEAAREAYESRGIRG